jgi:hypothetical protein
VAIVVQVEPRFGARAETGGDLLGGHIAREDQVVCRIENGSFGIAHGAFVEA